MDTVCSLCLVSDVKLYNLREHPSVEHFEAIIGINPMAMVDLPNTYACFECFALIKKFYTFREKCIVGQTTLCDLVYYKDDVCAIDLNSVDRERLKLTSNLRQCTILEESVINITHDEEVKMEIPLVTNVEECDVKIEFEDHAHFMDSSDEEPLSLHKTKKVEKKDKKVTKKRKREVEAEWQNEHHVKLEVDIEAPAAEKVKAKKKEPAAVEEVKVKKKRGPKKNVGLTPDEVDMAEYVNIVKLTLEQQVSEVEGRRESSNYVNSLLKCDLCYKGFVEEHTYKNHMAKHDPDNGPEICVVCKVRFATRRALQKHAANHEKKYACKSCDYVSKTTTQAKQHQKWHKGVTYKCQYCDEISTKWTSYLSHVRIKHPSEFICCACGYSYVSKLGLTMHKTMMHKDLLEESNSGPYCEQCSVKFVNEEAYKRHLIISTNHNFLNGCRVCGSSFPTAEELRLHHRRQHARKRMTNYGKKPTAQEWPNKCEQCDVMVLSAREHWAHYRRAHPNAKYPINKAYICEICGKGFRGNAFLVYHKRTHSTVREYTCSECPKSFFNRTNLQMHQRTHSEHRPHVCQLCGKGFKSKGALDRHFRCHTGIKPHKCEFCGKAFSQSNSCKLHIRTVHLKQPAPYLSKARLQRRRENNTSNTLQYNTDATLAGT